MNKFIMFFLYNPWWRTVIISKTGIFKNVTVYEIVVFAVMLYHLMIKNNYKMIPLKTQSLKDENNRQPA